LLSSSLSRNVDDMMKEIYQIVSEIAPLENKDSPGVSLRRLRSNEGMEMTPMVDVTFLLLIFFMITASFNLQKSIAMPRQQTDLPGKSEVQEPPRELSLVEVEIDESGGFLVTTTIGTRETPGKQNLITALKETVEGNRSGVRLVVRVHEMAKLSALVDAIDAGTIARVSQLEVTQLEPGDWPD
jgi:biopolymer transport protein ExbD